MFQYIFQTVGISSFQSISVMVVYSVFVILILVIPLCLCIHIQKKRFEKQKAAIKAAAYAQVNLRICNTDMLNHIHFSLFFLHHLHISPI